MYRCFLYLHEPECHSDMKTAIISFINPSNVNGKNVFVFTKGLLHTGSGGGKGKRGRSGRSRGRPPSVKLEVKQEESVEVITGLAASDNVESLRHQASDGRKSLFSIILEELVSARIAVSNQTKHLTGLL